MKNWILAGAAALALGIALPHGAAIAAPPPPFAFAADAAIDQVQVSPDGAHVVAMTSPDGLTPYISVWSTANLSAKPTILGSAHMRILGVGFIKNDRLAVTAIQTYDDGEYHGHLYKIYITDLEGKNWITALPELKVGAREERRDQRDNTDILSTLPRDPQHILVEDENGDVYKVNVYNGDAERTERASEKFGELIPDLDGVIRARSATDFENGKIYVAQWIRGADGVWSEHFRSFAKDREITSVVGFTPDPNIVDIQVSKGHDKAGLFTYDIKQRKILEPLFEHRLFDADKVIVSRAAEDYGRPIGFTYAAETPKIYWVDPKMAAIDTGVAQALGVKTDTVHWIDTGGGPPADIQVPHGFSTQLVSWSYDMKYVVVEKSGPNQPPEYYLLTDGAKLALLGKSRPQIDTSVLGDSQLIEYTARDGMVIPAFLHTPPKSIYGAGPYPAIVLPHGGPWARDYLSWDPTGWNKYFTSRGFVVIQPQYRGSDGWGQKLWRAGDAQWGLKMQDDNDDAAKYLIAQHLAAPNRIALFGYSYGGYAAFAAAVRPNGLYQCAISGAGVATIKEFQGDLEDNRFGREFQRPAIDGLDVIGHVNEVSIPIFIYGGDRDTNVTPKDPKKFAAALTAQGKPVKYLSIPDMGHEDDKWTPAMFETQLVEVDKYLHGDCHPPGGL